MASLRLYRVFESCPVKLKHEARCQTLGTIKERRGKTRENEIEERGGFHRQTLSSPLLYHGGEPVHASQEDEEADI